MKYLDGKHSKEQILDELVKHVASGELNVNKDNKPVTEPKAVRELVKPYLENCLAAYSSNALLVG